MVELQESNAIKSFSEHESFFKERTGNDFTFFYKKYYPKLIYYTSKMCGDSQKAEDVTIESFMTAFEKIDKYEKDKAQFSTWLFTIARNIMLQDFKLTKKTISLDIELDEDGTTMKDFIQEDEDTSYISELNDKKAEIMKRHITSLKQPYREVIEMREIKKMVYKDIASDLGKDVNFQIQINNEIEELPMELSRVYSIKSKSGDLVDGYELIEGDTKKSPFFTQIKLSPGCYEISGRNPKSLSTIKSQIRNGRAILVQNTRKEFDLLDDMFL